jgi:hypothetical protein
MYGISNTGLRGDGFPGSFMSSVVIPDKISWLFGSSI